MDTHIASSPEFSARDAHLSARLPGEPEPGSGAPSVAVDLPEEGLKPLSPSPKKGRSGLLAGVAIVGTVVMVGGFFVFSPFNHVVPVPPRLASTVHHLASNSGLRIDQPLAPSASLARVDVAKQPSEIVIPPYEPKPKDRDLSELLGMRVGDGLSSTKTAAPAAVSSPSPGAYIPHEPGASVAVDPLTPPARSAPLGAARIEPPTPPAVSPPVVPAREAKLEDVARAVMQATVATRRGQLAHSGAQEAPVAQTSEIGPQARRATAASQANAGSETRASRLLASPMTNSDQVKVLELVTQMATIVHDLKLQNASLRSDFARTKEDESARLADFERRIDLAEARRAVAEAASPADGSNGGENAVSPARNAPFRRVMAMTPVSVTRSDAAIPSVGPEDAKRYRVQAASPGLALLTEVERGGGDGAQIQVTVGDSIPGWGRVKAVGQRGTTWIVSTDHGSID